ncbi:MAG TPA: hypothetical protein PLO87_00005 [Ornithinibacter sp.]|mgnify:FL=1|jgi:3-hydroxyacyl-CoA dehydrogenase|nr:hypothetical protein [Ornithinibacter sp.]HOB80807.1 hypothetical protein [Ornithinibacter sp.]HPV90803.1 hypothetical protein [Ornithinibacter sp.]HQA12793.1 hypothetical protein [Ornithinibacter sp.]HQD66955.1 hypothetical protein [Ornithinibacter sp.]
MYGIDLTSMASWAMYVEFAKAQVVVLQRQLDDAIEGHDAAVVTLDSAVGEGRLTREQADLILASYESQARRLTEFLERFKRTFGLD